MRITQIDITVMVMEHMKNGIFSMSNFPKRFLLMKKRTKQHDFIHRSC